MAGESTLARELPQTCLPSWGVAELPEPPALSWRHWTRFIGPGIVMMGIQIGGGEWLFGPEITARYGGGLMWIATIAIICQVFYNIECGRYALYCGEPVFTGFMRTRPGPMFWMGVVFLLNTSSFIPGLSTHAAAMLASLILDRPPSELDSTLVTGLAYVLLIVAVLPVLIGGKIYNTLQWVMTTKVVVVLGFCLLMGVLCVSSANWGKIFSGFLKFGTVPTIGADGEETTVNLFTHRYQEGVWPLVAMGNIAVLGAFAGYAGGGGLSNATYSNFVRDKGWGMGSTVGAIPSAVGGHSISLSHLGKVFAITPKNLERWRGWWRYILTDQALVWGPGCVMGMALPALLSLQFAPHSALAGQKLDWAQSLITADGIRHAPQFAAASAKALWIVTVLVGMLVMLPSQMSVVDDISRRWTDIFWSGSRRVRESMSGNQVRRIYYSILGLYVLWSLVCAYLFSTYGTPKLMTIVIANLNNLAIGVTALHLLWINTRLLPRELRPRWFQRLGVLACGVFYLGLALLVFVQKQLPELIRLFDSSQGAIVP
ncbi:MAG TPA: Nramp family divalent metal transporter [Pirellulales bacterium]|jgi:hypothetical protein